MRIAVYSDISCPWCYIASRALRCAIGAFEGADDLELVARPYQIDGERPAEPTPMLEFLAAKYGHDRAMEMSREVTETGARVGIEFDNASGFAVNTLQAHRMLYLVGGEYGWRTRLELEEQLFAAWFTHGGNVADQEVLVGCAKWAGVPRDVAERFAGSDEGLMEVRALIAAARDEVRVVPTVVFGSRTTIENAQHPQIYLDAMRSMAAV
ncbi:DsbA family oxidoreductase [Spongiactinospora sp. 9N601]|uniref:DsbA family oxidoreductase n=1 Tax=Spongiactinospora sp. 9N601 TaxID=3375149 RepID=UPI003790D612